jgi:hypothetical protein
MSGSPYLARVVKKLGTVEGWLVIIEVVTSRLLTMGILGDSIKTMNVSLVVHT